MSIAQRTKSILLKQMAQQQSQCLMSDSSQRLPLTQCKQKILKLILKLQKSKAKSQNQLPVKIRQRIFIGNYSFASDQQFLQRQNIGLILSCMGIAPLKIFQGINYEKIPIKDQNGEDVLQYQEKVFNLFQEHLENSYSNIYIHCFQGKSRSIAVLMMYLMRKQGKQPKKLFSEIKDLYPLAQPNSWFVQQLKEYQKFLGLNASNQKTEQSSPLKKYTQKDDLLESGILIGQEVKNNDLLVGKQQIQEGQMTIQRKQRTIHGQTKENFIQKRPRSDLLIPQSQKSQSSKTQYHLISISDDEQQGNNLKSVQNVDIL